MSQQCPNGCGNAIKRGCKCPDCGAPNNRKAEQPRKEREKMIDRSASDKIFRTMRERGMVE